MRTFPLTRQGVILLAVGLVAGIAIGRWGGPGHRFSQPAAGCHSRLEIDVVAELIWDFRNEGSTLTTIVAQWMNETQHSELCRAFQEGERVKVVDRDGIAALVETAEGSYWWTLNAWLE